MKNERLKYFWKFGWNVVFRDFKEYQKYSDALLPRAHGLLDAIRPPVFITVFFDHFLFLIFKSHGFINIWGTSDIHRPCQ